MQTTGKTSAARSSKAKVTQRVKLTFEVAARELGCDEDEARFEANLKKVAGHKPEAARAAEPPKPKKAPTVK